MSDLARRAESSIEAALERGDTEAALAEAGRYRREATGPLLIAGQPGPAFRALLVGSRTCLAAGRPAEARDLLDQCLTVINALTVELAVRVRLLAAESQFRCGDEAEARRQVSQAAPGPWPDHPTLWLRSLRVRLWLGDLPLLADELVGCARVLSLRGDRSNLALLRCEEGCAHDRGGDAVRAEAAFVEAEELAGAEGANAILADAVLQRGRLAHLRGRLGEALQLFQRVLQHGRPAQAQEARLRIQLVYLDLGQWELVRGELAELSASGFTVGEEARPLLELLGFLTGGEPASGLSDEAIGFGLAATGHEEEARAHFAAALTVARGPERRARLRLALGVLASSKEGDTNLREAVQLAREHGLPAILERALYARGERVAGNDEEAARLLFEEAESLGEGECQQTAPYVAALQRRHRRGALRCLLDAACRRGDAAAVLRYQERERGRLLLEWLTTGAGGGRRMTLSDRPEWQVMTRDLSRCESALSVAPPEERAALGRRRGELFAWRDRLLERHLLESDRPAELLPPGPGPSDVTAALPPGTLYAAAVLEADRFSVLAVTRGGAEVVRGGPAHEVRSACDAVRAEVEAQMRRYQKGHALGSADRARLDGLFERVGAGPVGKALDELLRRHAPNRLLWAADEGLHGLPVAALRFGGGYLIERTEVCHIPGAALLVEQHRRTRRRGSWRPAVAFGESPAALPAAAREAEGVAAAFLRGRCVTGPAVDRPTLRTWLRRARIVHLACHAEFEPDRPLAARVRLPSGESLHAMEWLDEPVRGVPLVTLSACRAGASAPLAGGEAFGLVTGLLAGGVRAVAAGLWQVADAEAPGLMWSFYRHLMRHPPASALALAQREAIAQPGATPLFWAAFALFGDPEAVPAPWPPFQWLAGWRQRRHQTRYPPNYDCVHHGR